MTYLQRLALNRAHNSFQQAAQAVLADPSDYRSECTTRALAHHIHQLKQQEEERPIIGLIIRRITT